MPFQITAGTIPNRYLGASSESGIALAEAASRINNRYADALSHPLAPHVSGHAQVGILKAGRLAPWLALDFLLAVRPHAFGISIDTWIARIAGRLGPGSTLGTLELRGERIFIRGPQGEDAYRAATLLWESVMEGWSDNQIRTLRLLREEGSQRKVAAAMGVTPQSVNDTLRRMHWPRLKKSLELMGGMLSSG